LEFIAGRRWSGSLFPLTPEYIAAGDVWITTGTDGQIAGFVGAAPRECACSSIRRRHRPCAAPRSDEARQGHTGLEQAARRGPADDPLADPNATRFYERGADRRVALGRRCPAACSRGVTLTSGVTGSADPNIKQAFGRVGELADPVIIVPPSVRTTRFTSQLKWRASAGFPDQAKKFPDGPIQFPAMPN